MMKTYKIVNKPNEAVQVGVWCAENAMFIPFDPDNTDYQAYLKWLEEGNTPEPADQGVTE